jgi:hypothetical protein
VRETDGEFGEGHEDFSWILSEAHQGRCRPTIAPSADAEG